MIIKGLKDFLKCLKYYLVPFGVLSIFFLFGVRVGFNGVTNAFKYFFSKAAEMVGGATIDWPGIQAAFMGRVSELDFVNNFGKAIATVTSADWIKGTLGDIAKSFFGDSLTIEMINELFNATMSMLVMALLSFLLFNLIGLAVGFFLMKLLLRKELTKVKIGRLILYSLGDAVLWIIFIVLIVLLSRLGNWVSILVTVIVFTSLPFIFICEGYLFHGIKKIPFSKVADIKSVLKVLLLEVIILLITAALSALLFLIFKRLIGLYLALPIVEIGIISLGLTAENYVVHMVEKEKEQIPEQVEEQA